MADPDSLTDDVIFALARQVGIDRVELTDDTKSPEVQAPMIAGYGSELRREGALR